MKVGSGAAVAGIVAADIGWCVEQEDAGLQTGCGHRSVTETADVALVVNSRISHPHQIESVDFNHLVEQYSNACPGDNVEAPLKTGVGFVVAGHKKDAMVRLQPFERRFEFRHSVDHSIEQIAGNDHQVGLKGVDPFRQPVHGGGSMEMPEMYIGKLDDGLAAPLVRQAIQRNFDPFHDRMECGPESIRRPAQRQDDARRCQIRKAGWPDSDHAKDRVNQPCGPCGEGYFNGKSKPDRRELEIKYRPGVFRPTQEQECGHETDSQYQTCGQQSRFQDRMGYAEPAYDKPEHGIMRKKCQG